MYEGPWQEFLQVTACHSSPSQNVLITFECHVLNNTRFVDVSINPVVEKQKPEWNTLTEQR